MLKSRRFWSITALLAIVAGAGSPLLPSAQAQTNSPATPSGQAIDFQSTQRTLTVHLNGLPLRQVLEELSKQTHINFRPPAPAQTFDSRPVTASFDRLPIERAIKQLLGPSNTAMIYGTARTSDHGAKPELTEVRVLDLGIIPITATTSTAASGANPSIPSGSRLTPEQLQARREAIQQRRADKQKGGRGRGGQQNTMTNGQKDASVQSSGDASKSAGGGQQPAGNAPPPTGSGGNGSGGRP